MGGRGVGGVEGGIRSPQSSSTVCIDGGDTWRRRQGGVSAVLVKATGTSTHVSVRIFTLISLFQSFNLHKQVVSSDKTCFESLNSFIFERIRWK